MLLPPGFAAAAFVAMLLRSSALHGKDRLSQTRTRRERATQGLPPEVRDFNQAGRFRQGFLGMLPITLQARRILPPAPSL